MIITISDVSELDSMIGILALQFQCNPLNILLMIAYILYKISLP